MSQPSLMVRARQLTQSGPRGRGRQTTTIRTGGKACIMQGTYHTPTLEYSQLLIPRCALNAEYSHMIIQESPANRPRKERLPAAAGLKGMNKSSLKCPARGPRGAEVVP